MRFNLIILFQFLAITIFAQVRILPVVPQDTDPEINTFTYGNKKHVVYFDPTAKKRNQLYIFLPGTNGTGFGAAEINKLAASLGYHVISLQYPDTVALAAYRRLNNQKVFSQGREEIISGQNVSIEYNINRANSIENRIIKLLLYLANKFPQENWEKFLDKNNDIVWDKIAIGGQSQGGGHAGYIGKKHKVARILMFASPKDYSLFFNAPADWMSWETATPLDRYFTFVHSLDDKNGCTFPQQIEIWKTLGMYNNSQLINVDSIAAPYVHSRILTSKKPQSFPHGAVITDANYLEVWRYMLTEE